MRYLPFVLLLAACLTQHDPRYCATSADCTAAGFPSCDPVKHECEVATDDMSVPDGGADDMAVVMCTDSSTCPAATPTCSADVCGACSGNTDCAMYHSPATPLCGPAGSCVECLANNDCSAKAATPFCGPSNTCVACLVDNNCTPHVCGVDNSCRACQQNSECPGPTGVCDDATGNCVDSSQIYLVDNGGMTIANCYTNRPTRNGLAPATAFCDIADAFSGRPYVYVTGHGAAFPYTPFAAAGVTYVGPGGTAAMPAVIAGASAVSAGIKMNSTSASRITKATIDGFEISAGGSYDGIDCVSSPINTPHDTLIVKNSYIHNAASTGIGSSSCDVTVTNSRVSQSSIRNVDDTATPTSANILVNLTASRFDQAQADGMSIDGVLTMDRCLVDDNGAGNGNGVQVNNAHFTITNSFFYLNGQAVEFNLPVPGGTAQSIFMFNTVAYNTHIFACYANAIQASIVIGNADGALTSAGGCQLLDVVTDSATALPVFVNSTSAASYDFHLAVDTPAHVTANQNCCIDKIPSPLDGGSSPLPTHDYDGTTRPKGAGSDIGAHEAM